MSGISGAKEARPELNRLLRDAKKRQIDIVVCWRLDRLGRSTKDLLEIASLLDAQGVNREVTEQHINTTTPEGRLFFTMVAAFAEFEHSMMRARTLDGLAAARARGRKGGRKAKLSEKQIAGVRARNAAGDPISDIAASFNVSRPTIYRALKG